MSDSDDQGELRRTNSYEEGENNVKDRRSNVQFDPSIHTKKPWTRSKKYGYLFDLLLENGKHTDWVICKKCCKTLTKEGITQTIIMMRDRCLTLASQKHCKKFAVCSCQPFSLVSDKSFLSFLDEFQKLTIQNYVIGHTIPARNLLPSPNTMSRRITSSMDTAKIQLLEQIAMLKQNGGGITLDFAKKGVDYLAVTAHYIDHNWALNDFVILFTSLPAGFHKTSTNVRNLVEEELSPRFATIWLHLKEKNKPVEGNSAYSVAMAQAAMECFTRKIGDLSTQDWLSTPSCSINKKLAVCGAFLDPFTHSQLKDICSKVPGFNYDTMKRTVCEEARHFSNATQVTETPAKRAGMF